MGNAGKSWKSVQRGIDAMFDPTQMSMRRDKKIAKPEEYGFYAEAVTKIKNKNVEHVLVYPDGSDLATAGAIGDAHSVGIPFVEGGFKDAMVLHNHPDKFWGGSFSEADLVVMASQDMKSMSAATRDGLYVVKKGKGKTDPMGLISRLGKDRDRIDSMITREIQRVKSDYLSGQFASKESALAHARQVGVGLIDTYYKKVLKQYGYVYTKGKGKY